jgi:hypothetical protein
VFQFLGIDRVLKIPKKNKNAKAKNKKKKQNTSGSIVKFGGLVVITTTKRSPA